MSNLHSCTRCEAQYSKDTEWVKGFATYRGTETGPEDFMKTGNVPKNTCPICGLPS